MRIIRVSRGAFAGGVDPAERHAEKLGYDCPAREGLTDAATALPSLAKLPEFQIAPATLTVIEDLSLAARRSGKPAD